MTYYYVAEAGISYFDRKGKYPIIKTIAKIVSLIALFMGSILNTKTLWALGDITFGTMAYVNLVTLVLLSKPLMKALKDYDYQRKLGLDPVFDPRKAGIQDAGYWEAYADHKNASNSAVINNDEINSLKKNSDRKSA